MMKSLSPYLISLIFMIGCHHLIVDETSSQLNALDFETAWEYINQNYPLIDYKDIDWVNVYMKYKARSENVVGDGIYQILFDMVGELQDGHASVVTLGGTKIRTFLPPRVAKSSGAFDPEVIRTYFDKKLLLTGNNTIAYEFIDNDIGYIRLSTFGSLLDGRQHEFAECLNYLSSAEGIIIDIRENDGGSSRVYDHITGYLISQDILSGYQISVREVIPPGTIKRNSSLNFTKPIILLINGTCFSAAEVFADRLRGQDHITLLGDTTAGAGMSTNADGLFLLPSGKGIDLNLSAIFRRDSIPIEWNGVPPDIYVSQDSTDAHSGIDHQLLEAMNILVNQN